MYLAVLPLHHPVRFLGLVDNLRCSIRVLTKVMPEDQEGTKNGHMTSGGYASLAAYFFWCGILFF
jgi:hypothetical protein